MNLKVSNVSFSQNVCSKNAALVVAKESTTRFSHQDCCNIIYINHLH